MIHRATVAIVGAGALGGATAHSLASKYGVREVRLIDESSQVAAGKALDIQQAGAVEAFDTRISSHDGMHAVVGAAAIILAGPLGRPDAEWSETDGVAVIRRIAALNSHAVIVCAGASHRRLVEVGVTTGIVPRHRLIGSAPLAFTAALRAVIALELRCSPLDVSIAALGIPPSSLVVPWSSATAAGSPIVRILDAPQLRRLENTVARLWPPGTYALASAAAYLCRSMLTGASGRVCPSFVVLEGELGASRRAAAIGVTMTSHGIARIVAPNLSDRERVLLENALRAES